MGKIQIHIELVPVEVAKKVLKRQQALAARNGKREPARNKSAKPPRGPRTLSKKRDGPGR